MELLNYIFNLNLILLALDHLVTGTLAIFYPIKAIAFYRVIFGADLPFTKENIFILKPWGALGIFASMIGVLPLFDPVKYRVILLPLVVLLLLRIYIRYTHGKDGEKYLSIDKKRNATHIYLIILCATLILFQFFVVGLK